MLPFIFLSLSLPLSRRCIVTVAITVILTRIYSMNVNFIATVMCFLCHGNCHCLGLTLPQALILPQPLLLPLYRCHCDCPFTLYYDCLYHCYCATCATVTVLLLTTFAGVKSVTADRLSLALPCKGPRISSSHSSQIELACTAYTGVSLAARAAIILIATY